jgi:hypothetical protein
VVNPAFGTNILYTFPSSTEVYALRLPPTTTISVFDDRRLHFSIEMQPLWGRTLPDQCMTSRFGAGDMSHASRAGLPSHRLLGEENPFPFLNLLNSNGSEPSKSRAFSQREPAIRLTADSHEEDP